MNFQERFKGKTSKMGRNGLIGDEPALSSKGTSVYKNTAKKFESPFQSEFQPSRH